MDLRHSFREVKVLRHGDSGFPESLHGEVRARWLATRPGLLSALRGSGIRGSLAQAHTAHCELHRCHQSCGRGHELSPSPPMCSWTSSRASEDGLATGTHRVGHRLGCESVEAIFIAFLRPPLQPPSGLMAPTTACCSPRRA